VLHTTYQQTNFIYPRSMTATLHTTKSDSKNWVFYFYHVAKSVYALQRVSLGIALFADKSSVRRQNVSTHVFPVDKVLSIDCR